MGDDELLPCPFCGGTPYERYYIDKSLHSHATVKWYAITCGNCVIHFDSEDREEIVRMWNTRTPTAEVEKAIEFAINYMTKARGWHLRTNFWETNEVLNCIEEYKQSKQRDEERDG